MDKKEFSAVVDFAVFDNNYKKTDRHPDRRGKIEMSSALLKEMLTVAQRGEQPLLEIAQWNSSSKDGKTKYLYTKMSLDEYSMNKAKEGSAPAAAPAPTPEPEAPTPAPVPEDDVLGFDL